MLLIVEPRQFKPLRVSIHIYNKEKHNHEGIHQPSG